MKAFILRYHTDFDPVLLSHILDCYIKEADREGINHDIAVAQMILETGYLKYGGVVLPAQNNYAGLGAIDSRHRGISFPNPEEGVRAHIQHLKAYASTHPLTTECVDPRFELVSRGSASTIFALSGKWAADTQYGQKIDNLLWRLFLHFF